MHISKSFVSKVITLTIGVLLLDILIRYILMETHLLSIRPFSAVTGGESHFYNIAKAFVWNLAMVGWCYLIYIMILSLIYYRFPTSFMWVYIRSFLTYLALSTIYVLISDVNREEVIIENIAVSIPLTYLVALFYRKWLFKQSTEAK